MTIMLPLISEGAEKLVRHLFLLNSILAIAIVFFQRKNPTVVWAWLLALYFLPGLGFVLYLLFGIDMHKQKMFHTKETADRMQEAVRRQERSIQTRILQYEQPQLRKYSDLIYYNLESSGAVLTKYNEVQIFIDGNSKFQTLLQDIQKAKKFVYIQYYIIKNDVLFQRIKKLLLEKAAEGVEIKILCDGMGSRSVQTKCQRELLTGGIQTAVFFPALFKRLHLRMNYRNHRKIVVIDGEIGYVGGFNVGKEYIDLENEVGHWRDTHLRIRGEAVEGLLMRFCLDWSYAAKEKLLTMRTDFFKENESIAECRIQIISSGPDSALQNIRNNYLKLIHKAERTIYIQTPYFVPDEAVFHALLIALFSGVRVHIMIPCKPDHPFVYWATYSYIGELVMAGAQCYAYHNGFLHAKGMVVDEEVLCYGTANMDIRSFRLNFEVNAIIYNEKLAGKMVELFYADLEKCVRITKEVYASRKLFIRVREQISRLLSPLL